MSATFQAPAEDHLYKFNVTMTCGGCSGAVERVLKKKLLGEKPDAKFDISLETQEVNVYGKDLPPYDDVLAWITKTGKKVNSGELVR